MIFMLARIDSKIQQRGSLKLTGTRPVIALPLLAIAFILLILWLSVHYLLRPDWINRLPHFFAELLVLLESAAAMTLGVVAVLYYWRRRNALRKIPIVTVEQLYTLSPADFEQYVAALFRKKGYQVKLRGRKGDRGVDLELVQNGGRSAIVQCKRYRHTIGPDIVRELFGTMIHERVHHGFLVTTADISEAAREWAAFKPMTLIDGPTLVKIATSLTNQTRS
jgi:restriction system protein